MGIDNGVFLHFVPQDDHASEGDDRWDREVQTLIADLKDVGGDIRRPEVAAAGHKGGAAAEIILALGSAGVVTAAVQVIRAWLSRPSRSLRLRYSDQDGKWTDIDIRSNNVSEDLVKTLIERLPK